MTLALTIAIALLVSFLLSGLESALLTLNPVRLRLAEKEGRRGARRLSRILKRRDHLLAAIVLLNASVNLGLFGLLAYESVTRLGGWGYAFAFVVWLPVLLIWAELLPKSIFRQSPFRLLLLFLPLVVLIDFTLRPVMLLLAAPIRWIFDRTAARNPPVADARREAFRHLTQILERDGSLDPAEVVLIHSVLDFHAVRVAEVMLPLSKVTAVPREMPAASVLALARETDIDQFPVMATNGDLVGVIDALELTRHGDATGSVEQYRHKLIRTDPAAPAIGVVKRLRHAGHQIAAVYNPNGRPIGIVSIEDMVKRMVLPGAGARR
ncbi:MAG: DUF21 domain-containing protein [Akkermansiaceae bacterium]|nr:DUF21 domain-containing protein [Akkermansiaceae bacterium]MCP5551996.1 DUF21 domain-containing protein [Akkermansiaceae bacterium]